MREILFRAKSRLGNKWEVGSLIAKYTNGGELFYDLVPLGEDGFIHCNIHQNTIGQFTGLLDKNGTKIFEGDLVAYTFANQKVIMRVSFDDGVFTVNRVDWTLPEKKPLNEVNYFIEVIGNIHDKGE